MSHTHKLLISSLSVALFIIFLLPSEQASASKSINEASEVAPSMGKLQPKLQLGVKYPLPITLTTSQAQPLVMSDDLKETVVEVQSGDSLSLIFSRAELSATTLYRIDNSGDEAKLLRKIHPGDTIHFFTNKKDQLQKLVYAPSKFKQLVVTKDPSTKQFQSKLTEYTVETRYKFARATIGNIFWNAGHSAGLEDGLIMELASIFGWDVDFALDVRSGDSFAVLYEQKFINGAYIGYGDIIAAEFINHGEVFQAALHSDGHYYAPDGKSMRKTFLRAPVHFKYISSSFNPRRLHPVTGKVRAHKGIDYAAKRGTPIMSAGDGKVIASAYNKYNGNYIFIKHSERYVTKYLHLTKRYVKNGQRVKQGKIIGTLGSTGRVTGPHLHYEFLVNGVHKNPRTVKLPQAKDIKEADKANFIAQANKWLTKLGNNKRVMLAIMPEPLPVLDTEPDNATLIVSD